MLVNPHSLRRIYADICRGYSLGIYEDKPIHVKHLTVFDETEIDSLREEVFERTRKRGIATEAERLAWLESKVLWTKKDELDLKMQRDYIVGLEKTRSKQMLQSQANQFKKQIDEANLTVGKLAYKRARLIDKTAESVADARVQYEYIRLTFFSDVELKTPLFAREDIEAFTDLEADTLLTTYIDIINQFGSEAMRHLVIQPFFTNQFYLCGDEIRAFFGKPIVDLTIYQTNLISYGQYFKGLITQNDIPKEMANHPDKIEEYVLRSRNMKVAADKMAQNADRVALIGATPEDLKAAGLEDGSAKVRADISREVKSGMEAAKTREVSAR